LYYSLIHNTMHILSPTVLVDMLCALKNDADRNRQQHDNSTMLLEQLVKKYAQLRGRHTHFYQLLAG
jgi:hypothetical protein